MLFDDVREHPRSLPLRPEGSRPRCSGDLREEGSEGAACGGDPYDTEKSATAMWLRHDGAFLEDEDHYCGC